MVQAFKRNARVLEGAEVGRLLTSNRVFARYMRVFLAGRPTWLA
jgi:hypothetical protein